MRRCAACTAVASCREWCAGAVKGKRLLIWFVKIWKRSVAFVSLVHDTLSCAVSISLMTIRRTIVYGAVLRYGSRAYET